VLTNQTRHEARRWLFRRSEGRHQIFARAAQSPHIGAMNWLCSFERRLNVRKRIERIRPHQTPLRRSTPCFGGQVVATNVMAHGLAKFANQLTLDALVSFAASP